ncbi:citrate lyase holo-[acyl-carrier protein] synthase [Clostridium beijerinckii]|uniref:citrate lyase holo-[acyl-carrier protein] synthase n=1 Tax=Clostridium beijerinckii TaxID=1520 RepID=A0A1S8S6K1_CLOBE|nr:citrate lyase holo-[acyl-carrier protein] synthase [Clostridium beijerinckii]NRY63176.1 holo-ACP synthase [Clostridium beijerinckii]OOM61047.1 Apo-citrate lyase phosphoribosyl-dephospho-CoA transferase [Clostridium beijerinckii]
MNKKEQVIEEILNAREKRAEMQRELINIYKNTLISFTLNIPGVEKHNPTFTKIHENGIELLEEELEKQNIKLLHKIVQTTADGDEAFLVVDADQWRVKRVTTSIEENHKLGRLFDFDVINVNGEQVSRSGIGLHSRKCLLCNNSAKACGRSRNHSVSELLYKIYELIDYEELYISNF